MKNSSLFTKMSQDCGHDSCVAATQTTLQLNTSSGLSWRLLSSRLIITLCSADMERSHEGTRAWGDSEIPFFMCNSLSFFYFATRKEKIKRLPSDPSSSSDQHLPIPAISTTTGPSSLTWTPSPPDRADQTVTGLHGARSAHDQIGHSPSVSDRGEPAGQEEPAGALRQLHPHPHLPASHLHHRPAEQLRDTCRERVWAKMRVSLIHADIFFKRRYEAII